VRLLGDLLQRLVWFAPTASKPWPGPVLDERPLYVTALTQRERSCDRSLESFAVRPPNRSLKGMDRDYALKPKEQMCERGVPRRGYPPAGRQSHP
jgi:hypothetical protein